MRPLRELSREGVRAILTDIDGTLTDEHGRVPAAVFGAMERARAKGLKVVPVTGRPAGWCDLIARTWPVDAVIGENGGLWFAREADGRPMTRRFAQDEPTRAANRARLAALAEGVLAAHPGAALSSDQRYREFDLAVDFCEDVPRLEEAAIDDIVSRLSAAGCRVKVSNVHVNAWFGDFDKASMARLFAADRWGWDIDGADAEAAVFFGDSPNDSPLFALFPRSVGVANVRDLAHRTPVLPAFVADGRGWRGFVQGVEHLLG